MPKSICREELSRHAPIATKSIVEETCGGSLEFLFSMKPCCEAPMMVNHNLLLWSFSNILKCGLTMHIWKCFTLNWVLTCLNATGRFRNPDSTLIQEPLKFKMLLQKIYTDARKKFVRRNYVDMHPLQSKAPRKKFAGSLKFLVCRKPCGDNS